MIEGRIDRIEDFMFNAEGLIDIKCKATTNGFVFKKKQILLRKSSRQELDQIDDNNLYATSTSDYSDIRSNINNEIQNSADHNSDEIHRYL